MSIQLIDNLIKFINAQQPDVTQPSFRISYFNFGGSRANPIRAAATIGGISYEDEFIGFDEHKQQKADNLRRWSGLPELTLYNKKGEIITKLGQSNNILRYVGVQAGLYPHNPVIRLLIDEILDSVEDFTAVFSSIFFIIDEDGKKKKSLELMADDKLPYWVNKFNNRLKENEKRGYKNGYVIGNSLTIADLKMYYILQGFASGYFKYIDPKILIDTKKEVAEFVKRIGELDAIKTFEAKFAAAQKQNKEKGTKLFKYDGTVKLTQL